MKRFPGVKTPAWFNTKLYDGDPEKMKLAEVVWKTDLRNMLINNKNVISSGELI